MDIEFSCWENLEKWSKEMEKGRLDIRVSKVESMCLIILSLTFPGFVLDFLLTFGCFIMFHYFQSHNHILCPQVVIGRMSRVLLSGSYSFQIPCWFQSFAESWDMIDLRPKHHQVATWRCVPGRTEIQHANTRKTYKTHTKCIKKLWER